MPRGRPKGTRKRSPWGLLRIADLFESEALADPFDWYRSSGKALPQPVYFRHAEKLAALFNATGTIPWPGYHTVETDIGTKGIKGDSLKKAWEREARAFARRFPSIYRTYRLHYNGGYLSPRDDGLDPLWLMLISEFVTGGIPESEAKEFARECDEFFKTTEHVASLTAWIGESAILLKGR